MKSLETKWILTRSYFKSNLTEMVIDVYNAENKKKKKKFVDLIRMARVNLEMKSTICLRMKTELKIK